MLTIIKPARSGFCFPVNIRTEGDNDYHLPLVRSFLTALDNGTLDKWGFRAVIGENVERWYRFDGIEVIYTRTVYVTTDPAILHDVMGTALIIATREANKDRTPLYRALRMIGRDVPATTVERRSVQSRDDARKAIYQAMGYTSAKAWKVDGRPVNLATLLASGKRAFSTPERCDAKMAAAELNYGASQDSTGVHVMSVSAIRPGTRDTGRTSGWVSHNK